MFEKIADATEKLDMSKMIEYFSSGQFYVSVIIIVAALLLILILRRTFRIIAKKAGKVNGKKVDKKSLPIIVEKVISTLLIFLAILAVLQVNGINVTSLVASLGLASAIIGLALQDYLKDVIMGVHILSDHFFVVGDVVRYKGMEGIVVSFTTKTTKIQSLDDASILSVSNRNIDEIAKVGDFMKINIPLSYEEELSKVDRVLTELTEQIKQIENVKTAIYKGAFSYQDSSILYRINYYADPKEKWTIWYKVMRIVQEGLIKEGITIPYNQLDVHEIPPKD